MIHRPPPPAPRSNSLSRADFGGQQVEIEVRNPDAVQKGVCSLIVNGTVQTDNLRCLTGAGEPLQVVAVMGVV